MILYLCIEICVEIDWNLYPKCERRERVKKYFFLSGGEETFLRFLLSYTLLFLL